ncbi:hypothetical protein HU200_035243 [Digitaria exilis]|uniref:Membrane-associated kinase regulator 6 n=1 Tax=Digitaria exilis TaxID=1010633 RepID=A0A835BI70_9POAL|nr:hypothetical protein HU200_035243 [Digitaria exilis]
MDTAPNALSPDVNSFVPTPPARAPPHRRPAYLPPISSSSRHSLRRSPRLARLHEPKFPSLAYPCCVLACSSMEASPSRSDSFSCGGWPRSKARCAPSFERLDVHATGGLGESFNSSTASFIDMDPEELFSMRWTSDDVGFDLAPPCAAGACSPLLASAGLVFSGDDSLLLPCGEEPSGIPYDESAGSSPAFHTARSTPASSVISFSSSQRRPGDAKPPLMATRRLLLRYLRFLAPLCRKARALRLAPARVFSSATRSSRSSLAAAATPARRSTSSASCASEYWCHGNADTAVRDAILHCKKSLVTARTEC